MKTTLLAILTLFGLVASSVQAATTIDPINKYAFGANLGWLDCSGGFGETATGVTIGAYFCSGYIYSGNVGWINLGVLCVNRESAELDLVDELLS
jgi:hypothetical protein